MKTAPRLWHCNKNSYLKKLDEFFKYSKNHSTINVNSGISCELAHHSLDDTGVNASIKNNNALVTNTPRKAPKTRPRTRSVPDKPVLLTSWPIK